MKKFLCLILAIVLCFCFTACKHERKDEPTLDIEYFAELGQIPECDYSLGDDPAKIEADFRKFIEEDEHYYLNIEESDNNVLIDNGTYKFYYKKDETDKGIAYLVTFDTAYGFEIGTISLEIKEALGETEYTEEKITDNNAFFILGAENGSVIKYKSENNTVLCVFDNNALCATAIYKNDWSK